MLVVRATETPPCPELGTAHARQRYLHVSERPCPTVHPGGPMPPLKAALGAPFRLHPQLLCSVARISGDHGTSSCQVSVTPGFSPPKSWDVVALGLLVLVAGGLQLSPADPLELRGPHSQPSLCVTQTALVCGTAGLGHTPACLGPGCWARRWARGRTPASPSARSRPASSVGLSRSNHGLLSLFEVGRPGAHHLVRVLHSDHEVSALCLLLLGCLTP